MSERQARTHFHRRKKQGQPIPKLLHKKCHRLSSELRININKWNTSAINDLTGRAKTLSICIWSRGVPLLSLYSSQRVDFFSGVNQERFVKWWHEIILRSPLQISPRLAAISASGIATNSQFQCDNTAERHHTQGGKCAGLDVQN